MQAILKAIPLIVLAFSVPAAAQITADPVSWSASASKSAGKSYAIRISSTLSPGWHIYAMNAGGDGTLIPTTFSFKPGPGVGKPGAVKSDAKPKAMTFPGVDGTAYVYEGVTDFSTTVTGAPGKTLNLTIGYQSCNDRTCLPPKKKVITIKLP